MSKSSKENLLGGARGPLALTGVGLFSPAGRGLPALQKALDLRRSCLSTLERVGLSGSADRGGLVPEESIPPPPATAYARGGLTSRMASLAVAAALDAVGAAELKSGRVAIHLGTALGAIEGLEKFVRATPGGLVGLEGGGAHFSHAQLAREVLELLEISARGVSWGRPRVFSVTCVSTLCALEQAAADLAFDRAEAAIVVGLDALSRFMASGFRALGALSPTGRLLPFDEEHDGILLGEGAAAYVVETLAGARGRGVSPLAVLPSQRLLSDANHLTSPDPAGRGMAAAVRGALEDAGLAASEVGGVTLTAVGSSVYDPMLERALGDGLGPEEALRVPVSSWEAATGHLLAATGAVGPVHGAGVLGRGQLPALWGGGRPDPGCALSLARGAPLSLRSPSLLALTVGFGGQNGAALLAGLDLANRWAVPDDVAASAGGGPDPAHPVPIHGVAVLEGAGDLQASQFPGRWNPRRSIPADIEPAATATARALEAAGWWRPHTGALVPGGLVVAVEGATLAPAVRFARDLEDRPGALRGPSDFLFSLPSTAAAVLGLLFGLPTSQATVVGGPEVALDALRHALDLLALRRVERVVLVTLSVTPDRRAATAWCLAPLDSASPEKHDPSAPGRRRAEIACGFSRARGSSTMPPPGDSSVALLERAARWIARGGSQSPESLEGEVADGWIQLRTKGL